MTKVKANNRKSHQKAAAATVVGAPSRPGGKLGLIIQRLGTRAGATVDDLAAATGWQRHTVHGALSRLRARGFAMRRKVDGDRKTYRLAGVEA